jgi:hypothetical protein
LISENQGLNVSTTPITAMGCQQCLPLSVVLQTWIFSRSPLKKKLGLYHKPEKNPGDKLKKIPGLEDLKFF